MIMEEKKEDRKEAVEKKLKDEGTEQIVIDNKDYKEIIKETVEVEKKEEKDRKIAWHEIKVNVTKDYEDAYIVVFYTEVMNTPKEALIYNPDFTRMISATAINENREGEIIFEVESPVQGEWTVLVLEEKNMGTYCTYVIEKKEYEQLKNEVGEEREVPY